MAVIQDLPAELLRRIIELLEDTGLDSLPQILARTSLVARAWRLPQALLVYHMDLDRPNYELLRSGAGSTVRFVQLDHHNAGRKLKVLEDHRISVETLGLYDTRAGDLDLVDIDLQLFAGLKSLIIVGSFAGQPTLPMDIKLELTHLLLTSSYLPSLSFLNSILPSAPFLTSLALESGEDGDLFPEEYAASFHAIAQQLRHLQIDIGESLGTPTSRPSPAVTRFVASCTSLRSLELYACSTAYLSDVVTAINAPLAVIETLLAHDWNKGGTGVAELAAVLELPAMANLRRWRVCEYDDWAYCLLEDEDEKAPWEAACRARGVEPRDSRRLFTDYLAE